MQRRHSPTLVAVGILTLLGALYLVGITTVWRDVLENTDPSENDMRVNLALCGLIPAVGTLATAINGRGRTWAWFGATLLWYLFVFVAHSP